MPGIQLHLLPLAALCIAGAFVCAHLQLNDGDDDVDVVHPNDLNDGDSHYDCLKMPENYMLRYSCCGVENLYGDFYRCASEQIERQELEQLGREMLMAKTSTTTTTMPTNSPSEEPELVEQQQFYCYLQNSTMIDANNQVHRPSVLEVMQCAYGNNGSMPRILPLIVDNCVADYQVALLKFPDDMLDPRYGCTARPIFLMSCMEERMFVNCPKEHWNPNTDDECEHWRVYLDNCSQLKMKEVYAKMMVSYQGK